LLLVCCAGKAFDELEAYLGQNDWAAFRAVAVLLGHILGASLQVIRSTSVNCLPRTNLISGTLRRVFNFWNIAACI
jgi:hypothetical protein